MELLRFIGVLIKTCQLTLFWATLIQATPWQPLSRKTHLVPTLKRTPWFLPPDKQKLRAHISPLQCVLPTRSTAFTSNWWAARNMKLIITQFCPACSFAFWHAPMTPTTLFSDALYAAPWVLVNTFYIQWTKQNLRIQRCRTHRFWPSGMWRLHLGRSVTRCHNQKYCNIQTG
jgi:hypothetical protein